MKPYANDYSLKKKVLFNGVGDKRYNHRPTLKLINKVFDTVNISLLILILILSFLSFNSQRKWSKTYNVLSFSKAINNNLIDHISKTEEIYLSELESFDTFKKTTPKDFKFDLRLRICFVEMIKAAKIQN